MKHRTGLFRWFVALVCAGVSLSALAGSVGAICNRPQPAWMLLGFEITILLAGIWGVRAAIGKMQDGVGITFLCVAGCVGVGSLLGFLGAGKKLLGMPLEPFLLARGAAAGVLAVASAVEVLSVNPRKSVPLLAMGVVLGLPVVVVTGAMLRGIGVEKFAELPGIVQAVIGFFGFGLFVGLSAASVHLVVRAFQVALATAPASERRATSAAST